MNKTSDSTDKLESLFKKLDKGSLSPAFRSGVLEQVFAEAARAHVRKERRLLYSVVAAALLLVGLAVVALIYLDIVLPAIKLPDQSVTTFYLFIAVLVGGLLAADYKLRRMFSKRHQKMKRNSL